MKIGVIGSGAMGSMLIDKILLLKHEIIGVYGHKNRDRYPNLYFTDDIQSIIDKADALFFAIPPEFNYRWIEKCLSLAKPVFVEKPMTDTLDKACSVQKLVKKHNGRLMVGHCLCFSENMDKYKDKNYFLCSIVNRREYPNPPKMNEYWNVGIHYVAICDVLGIDDIDIHFVFNDKIKHSMLDVLLYDGELWVNWTVEGDIYLNEIKHFFDCLESGTEFLTNVDHAVKCIEYVNHKYGLLYPDDLHYKAW